MKAAVGGITRLDGGTLVGGQGKTLRAWPGRIARAWLRGWFAFAAVSGGRAEDLVGPNPWRLFRQAVDEHGA